VFARIQLALLVRDFQGKELRVFAEKKKIVLKGRILLKI
jgi:hypothetical protein